MILYLTCCLNKWQSNKLGWSANHRKQTMLKPEECVQKLSFENGWTRNTALVLLVFSPTQTHVQDTINFHFLMITAPYNLSLPYCVTWPLLHKHLNSVLEAYMFFVFVFISPSWYQRYVIFLQVFSRIFIRLLLRLIKILTISRELCCIIRVWSPN